MKNILAIDTSTKNFSLAVAKDGKIVKVRNARLKRPLSSSIIPSIKRILTAAGLALADLDGFAVGIGPGSFTSLRVGLATVKGLAFAGNKPVIGVSSLDILALNAADDDAQICVLADAKRNMVYAGLYAKNRGRLVRKGDYHLDHVDQILKNVKGPTVFIGDGVPLYREHILKRRSIKPVFTDETSMFPQARHLAALALNGSGQKGRQAGQIVPLYLYPEHCQVQHHPKKRHAKK